MSCVYPSGETPSLASQISEESSDLIRDCQTLAVEAEQALRVGLLDRVLRKLVFQSLSHISGGILELEDEQGCHRFGSSESASPVANIRVNDPRFYRRVVLGGSLDAAESYRQGEWDTADLCGLLQLLAQNLDAVGKLERFSSKVLLPFRQLSHRMRRNTRSGSRKNISAHYDLSNDFFRMMLDPTLTYSSGVFSRPGMTLIEAQYEKYERICQKLELKSGDRLLEIGTGWGGFAEHAARHYGCHVTTTTISNRQYQYAQERFRTNGLDSRVSLLKQDYRELSGQFDKLASIEMVEAVGDRYLGTYFGQCSRLLKANGLMCIQAITIPDHRYSQYRRSMDFIQRYIFPGGCLPSFSAITRALADHTDLRLVHSEDFGTDYATTIKVWRSNFWNNIEKVRSLGFDNTWIRTWEYYLCYCMAGFLERQIGVSQILFAKPRANAG